MGTYSKTFEFKNTGVETYSKTFEFKNTGVETYSKTLEFENTGVETYSKTLEFENTGVNHENNNYSRGDIFEKREVKHSFLRKKFGYSDKTLYLCSTIMQKYIMQKYIIKDMIQPRNPFIIGHYVGPEYFCDRVEETRLLHHHVDNGRNVVIMSDRRLGKTGLIEHLVNLPDLKENYHCFFIDIYMAHSMRELVCELANEIFRRMSPNRQKFLHTVSTFLHSIQTTFSLDQSSGLPQMSISLGDIEQPELTLDELFAMLEAADKPCLIAIDEFQQISSFEEGNIEAVLRTKIQHLKNVQFIFAGSKRHLLEDIFNNPSRPFYNSVVFMQLLPIQEETYIQFCEQLFASYHRILDASLTRRAYQYFSGVTWYLQLFMNEAFSLTDREDSIDVTSFDDILQHLIDTKRFTFEEIYSRLTEKQKAVIRAIATDYPQVTNPMSKDFIATHKLKTSSAVQTALKGLEDKGIIQHDGESRQINDILFAIWLKQRG